MFKNLLFQLHWLLGISAGLVLSLMAVTGASLSFGDEIVRWANPPVAEAVRRHAGGETALPVTELARRLGIEADAGVARLLIDPTGTRPSLARLSGERRGEIYFDPYSGVVLPEPRGEKFFHVVEDLHRHLAAGERGKAVTGVCVIILLFFCLSGLYLRWPRQWWSWRTWWMVEWKRQGRGFLWSLHSVIGTWCLLLYLVIALTGLYWSYGWYRQGLVMLLGGQATMQAAGRGGKPVAIDFARLQAALDTLPDSRRLYLDIRIPTRAAQPLSARYLPVAAAHDRAFDVLEIDSLSGRIVRTTSYASLPAGRKILSSLFALHSGSYFGLPGRIAWMLASMCMVLFFITGWMLYLDRRGKQSSLRQLRADSAGVASADSQAWLVVFASQTGYAEQLAWQTAGQLQAAGKSVQVRPLAQLDGLTLQAAHRVLLVVSNFGDGQAPDAARSFEKNTLRQTPSLGSLNYAMLALGDRQYPRFCGFSRRLEQWLGACGAQALFPTVELDNADARGLQLWQQHLLAISVIQVAAFVAPTAEWQAWRLLGRTLLNPGSSGAPVWRIDLQPPAGVDWKAGDILVIQPQHADTAILQHLQARGLDPQTPVNDAGRVVPLLQAARMRVLPPLSENLQILSAQVWLDALEPLASREYSIASIPQEGVLQLVVRLARHIDGQPGVGSGWLALHAPPGSDLYARVRANPGFRRVTAAPMILVGNGSGIAGLRSLLAEARHVGENGHWLLFGERNVSHDRLLADELAGWCREGVIQRLDLTFSRDQVEKIYVQHRLRESAEELREWLARGAVIQVCGSLRGMAQGVDQELRRQLGEIELEALQAAGRYRRDVY